MLAENGLRLLFFNICEVCAVNFHLLWELIKNNEGQVFHTITGLPFTYRVENDVVHVSRTSYRLTRNEFEKAFQQMPIPGPGQISGIIRGPSYIYAILSKLLTHSHR